jgi:hypothetical protein
MTINDLLNKRIIPFEVKDEKLKALFSFFLHRAPSISSSSATVKPDEELTQLWDDYLVEISIPKDCIGIYASGYINDSQLSKYSLAGPDEINRKANRIIGYKKDVKKTKGRNELDCECVLRHLRNSIAHGNVFVEEKTNRKYILFDDYNENNHLTGRILLSMTNLIKLKKYMS